MAQDQYWEDLLAAEGMPAELPFTENAVSSSFEEPGRSEPVFASNTGKDSQTTPEE